MASLTPFVFWGQNKSKIFLKIDLKDVKSPVVDLGEDRLEFTAHGIGVRGKNDYTLAIDFYLPIDVDKSQYRVTDRNIEFQLYKVGQAETWPRLTENQARPPWLKIDFDHFAFDDEDSGEEDLDNMQMNEEEMMERLERELLDGRKDLPPAVNLRIAYLFMYNMFQWVGYTFVFISLLVRYLIYGSLTDAFASVGSQLMLLQLLAVLEVVHPLLGIVQTGALMPMLQVFGRNLCLFGLIYCEEALQQTETTWFLFTTWSCVEVFRYPFYALSTVNMEWKWVTWLRYSVWIPLYPAGFLFEGVLMLLALPHFDRSGKLSIELPNAANISFNFPIFLRIYMCLFLVGGYFLMKKMYETRKKKLGIKSPTTTKTKKKA